MRRESEGAPSITFRELARRFNYKEPMMKKYNLPGTEPTESQRAKISLMLQTRTEKLDQFCEQYQITLDEEMAGETGSYTSTLLCATYEEVVKGNLTNVKIAVTGIENNLLLRQLSTRR